MGYQLSQVLREECFTVYVQYERHRIMMLVPTTLREVAVLSKYRIVSEEWVTAFGEKRITPAVQVRVGFFWWVTLTRCESVKQARYYIEHGCRNLKLSELLVMNNYPFILIVSAIYVAHALWGLV